MAQIKLEGSRIMWDGQLSSSTQERMSAGGAVRVYGFMDKPTLVVIHDPRGDKALKARGRGITSINVAQLERLLAAGVLELEEAAGPVVALDEAVAELRAVFDGEPSSARWTRCLEIFEACDEDRVEDLLAYAQPLIARWDVAELGAWEAPHKHALTQGTPSQWRRALFTDELRVAPLAWCFELAQGRYSKKHAIIRALVLEGMNLNGKLASAIFASPHMRHVRRVNLGAKPLPAMFYKALRTSEVMRSVEELWFYDAPHAYQAAWTPADHTFDALKLVQPGSMLLPELQAALPCIAGAQQGEGAPWV